MTGTDFEPEEESDFEVIEDDFLEYWMQRHEDVKWMWEKETLGDGFMRFIAGPKKGVGARLNQDWKTGRTKFS